MSKKNFISVIMVIFLILSVSLIWNTSYAAEEKFGGLGMKVAQLFDPDAENKTGSLVVLDVLDGTPASKSGVRRGDVITHIDGELTKGRMFKYLILEKLRGETGSEVDISIERAGVKTPLNFTLIRIEITYTPEKEE